jgi:hypothetical protein
MPRTAQGTRGVFGGAGGVGPAARGAPYQDARFWLIEPLALGLFYPVMMSAQRTTAARADIAVELGKDVYVHCLPRTCRALEVRYE